MKKSTKFTAAMLSGIMVFGALGAVPLTAGAAETAEAEAVIYFDVANSGWEDVKKVYCHLGVIDDDGDTDWTPYQTRKEICTYDSETGIATYKLSNSGSNVQASDGNIYQVLFSAETNDSTKDDYVTREIVMNGACIGDTLYCTGEQLEYNVNQYCYIAKWEKNSDLGSMKYINHIGNVIGTTNVGNNTDSVLFADYLIINGYGEGTSAPANLQSAINEGALVVYRDDVEIYLKENVTDDSEKLEYLMGVLDDFTFSERPATEPTTEPTTTSPTTTEPTTNEPSVTEPVSTLKLGDVNGDGTVDISDATEIQKGVAQIVTLTDAQKTAADVNGDGAVDISDATEVQKFVAEIITKFAAEG